MRKTIKITATPVYCMNGEEQDKGCVVQLTFHSGNEYYMLPHNGRYLRVHADGAKVRTLKLVEEIKDGDKFSIVQAKQVANLINSVNDLHERQYIDNRRFKATEGDEDPIEVREKEIGIDVLYDSHEDLSEAVEQIIHVWIVSHSQEVKEAEDNDPDGESRIVMPKKGD